MMWYAPPMTKLTDEQYERIKRDRHFEEMGRFRWRSPDVIWTLVWVVGLVLLFLAFV